MEFNALNGLKVALVIMVLSIVSAMVSVLSGG